MNEFGEEFIEEVVVGAAFEMSRGSGWDVKLGLESMVCVCCGNVYIIVIFYFFYGYECCVEIDCDIWECLEVLRDLYEYVLSLYEYVERFGLLLLLSFDV